MFDGDRCVGRIYQANDLPGQESWFWGVSFQLTSRKRYANAQSLEEVKAAFRADYLTWK